MARRNRSGFRAGLDLFNEILGREPSADDIERARQAWELFHDKPPRPAKDIHLHGAARDWPKKWGFGGKMKTVYYASDKWEKDGDFINYYHDHGKGVGFWMPKGEEPWLGSKRMPVRSFPESVAVLGYCLGWDYQRVGTDRMFRAAPEDGEELLCSFPDRKRLIVVHPERGVVALISGPGLIVEARGIVG